MEPAHTAHRPNRADIYQNRRVAEPKTGSAVDSLLSVSFRISHVCVYVSHIHISTVFKVTVVVADSAATAVATVYGFIDLSIVSTVLEFAPARHTGLWDC